MSITVNISNIIDELEMMNSDMQSFLNIQTGKIITMFDNLESEYATNEIENNTENYISLPTHYDINEYSIMEDFIDSLDDIGIENQLSSAINGKGAFSYFRDTIRNLGIENKWFEFKANAFKEIAIKWCKENNISYE